MHHRSTRVAAEVHPLMEPQGTQQTIPSSVQAEGTVLPCITRRLVQAVGAAFSK